MTPLVDRPPTSHFDDSFLLKYTQPPARPIGRNAVIGSVVVHIVGLLVVWNVEFETAALRQRNLPDLRLSRVTPLVTPPDIIQKQLTQKAPNQQEPAKELDVQGLIPRPEAKKAPRIPARSPQPTPGLPAASLPDAPQLAASTQPSAPAPPPGFGTTNTPPPPPQIETSEKPKIRLENVPGTGLGSGNIQGGPSAARANIPVPRNTVNEAVAAVSRRPGGGLVVGDDADPVPSLGESLSQQAAPGKMGSSLELLSDPQGADFRPYLLKVLSAVRRNWFAVIPESARLGRQGRVLIQFAISKNGAVPKLVIASPSGAEPLDRAAVAGISASNPFPPLPTEFKGDQIRLQLSFVYNARR